MDKQLTQEENKIVDEAIKIRLRTSEERKAFIQGRISGLGTALDLIKGQFQERIAILKEISERDLENDNYTN